MALLAPVFGGSVFGNLALLALGIGVRIATSLLFPQKVKGPRQENLKAQTSRYGDHIARVHGSARVAGAVIWLKNDQVDEHKKKKEAGKGGQETVTYSYTCDVAVAFAFNGPFEAIPRIWADDKLVYDNGALDFTEIIEKKKKAKKALKKADITIYLGTQDQTPDPNIEADRESAPAWPGVCYVVVTGFPLDSFGVRIPNFEAEVVQYASVDTYVIPYENTVDIPNFPYHYDTKGDYVVALLDGNTFQVNSLPTGEIAYTKNIPDGYEFNTVHISERNEILISSDPPDVAFAYDLASGELLSTFPWILPNNFLTIFMTSDSILINGTEYWIVAGYGKFGLFSSTGGGEWVCNGSFSGTGLSPFNPCLWMSLGEDYMYYYLGSAGGGLRMSAWDSGTIAVPTEPSTPSGVTGTLRVLHYDQDLDVVFWITTTGIWAVTPDLTTVLYGHDGDFAGTAIGDPLMAKRIDLANGNIAIMDNGGSLGAGLQDFWEYKKSDLSVVQHVVADDSAWAASSNNVQRTYYAMNDTWNVALVGTWNPTPDYELFVLPQYGPGRISLAELVKAECNFVELENDTTGLIGTVHGYAVRDGSPPRGVIEDLMRVKFFDFAHIDGVTTFFMRKTTSAATLTLPYLGHSDNNDPKTFHIVEEYADLKELPERVLLNYQSFDGDYRKGSQSIARPESMDETKQTLQYETSLIMNDDEAAQSADIMFNESREVAVVYKSSVPIRFMEHYPGEVLSLQLDESRSINAVMTKMQGDVVLEMEFRKRTSDFSSTAVGIPTPPNDDSLLDIGESGIVFIDGHLMLESHAEDGSFYIGVYLAEIGDFGSTTIYRSTNGGLDFSPWMGLTESVLRGFSNGALFATPHPDAWDRSSFTFNVIDTDGVPNLPSSVTEEELLADTQLNAFAVSSGDEWEYIRAATVIDNGDGTWTLTDMLRGRMGTDFACTGHADSDEVVYLDATALNRAPDADRGLERVYVPTNLTGFDTDLSETFTNYGKGLRPWSPVDLEGSRDGGLDLTVTWKRRDRLGQEWPEGGAEDPPMSESTEAYKVYIYDTGTLVRTINATVESATYTAAQQITDFGSEQASIDIGVVQVSSTYGDGVEELATV